MHAVEALSATERDELMHALAWDEGDELSAEWRDELQSRVNDIDEGTVRLIPHQDVMKRFRDDLDLPRENHA